MSTIFLADVTWMSGLILRAWFIASPIISMFRSIPLRKRVSLQNVAYSFGRSSMNDSISKIDDRMSDRYFFSFLSID